MKSGWRIASVVVAVVSASPIFAPQLLAFPYSKTIGAHEVHSVRPVSAEVTAAIIEGDRKVAASPSGSFRAPDQPIFLTGGGWRWRWLAAANLGAFALTRPVNDAIIVNRTDDSGRRVLNSAKIAGTRPLSGVVAHEMTHGSIDAHFGLLSDNLYPVQIREGYCDYVAGGTSLSDAQAFDLLARGQDHPALVYWQGHKLVTSELSKAGGDIDRLFAKWKGR